MLSHCYVRLCVALWTVACQVPLPMEFSRQEYWNGVHFLLQGIFPTQGSNLRPLHWELRVLTTGLPGKSLLQDTEYSFLWYTVDTYCLFIYI